MGGTASKTKGTKYETGVITYMRERGLRWVERKAAGGSVRDEGDVAGIRKWTLELKKQNAMNLAGWVDEMLKERGHNNTPFGAVIHGRVMKSIAKSYVTMELEQFVTLLIRLGDVEVDLEAPGVKEILNDGEV